MDAVKIRELEAGPAELRRRRGLAKARRERENEREALLVKLIETERQAGHLRAWIAGQESHAAPELESEFARMVDWARAQLAPIEVTLDPVQLSQMLRDRNLFPEIDTLDDPQGEPPPLTPWGR